MFEMRAGRQISHIKLGLSLKYGMWMSESIKGVKVGGKDIKYDLAWLVKNCSYNQNCVIP